MPRFWFNYEHQGDVETVGGFPLTISTDGSKKKFYEIDLSSKFSGQKIVISTFREFVAVKFLNASEDAFGKTVGMLGDFVSGETLARDGTTVMGHFAKFGNEWQVLPGEPDSFTRLLSLSSLIHV